MGPLAFAIKAMTFLADNPSIVDGGIKLIDLAKHANDRLKQMQDEKRDPTPAEWDELNARIRILRDELHS